MGEPGERHVMDCEAENAGEILFACPTCGRKVVVGKAAPKFVVIDRGDPLALHSGSTGGLSLAATVAG